MSVHRANDTSDLVIIARSDGDLAQRRDRFAVWGEIEGEFAAVRLNISRLKDVAARRSAETARQVASWLDARREQGEFIRAGIRLVPTPSPRAYPRGRAIVVGGTGAIGADLVRVLAERQVDVAFTTRRLDHRAENLLDELSEHSSEIEAHQLDVTEDGATDRLFELLNTGRDVHSVFFAAGIPVPQRYVNSISWGEWERAVGFEINGFFRVAQSAMRILKQNGGGALVAMTTVATLRYPLRDGLSGAPKAAVETLVRAIAREEGRFGIRANCVAPGLIQGGVGQAIIDEFYDAPTLENIRASTATRRFCTARDCAEAAVFLASMAALSITGHVIPVDGGFHI